MKNADKFLTNREAAKTRHPRYDGWYWWRANEDAEPVRYLLQFEGKQATSENGGTVPASALGGEWGNPAPSPEYRQHHLLAEKSGREAAGTDRMAGRGVAS